MDQPLTERALRAVVPPGVAFGVVRRGDEAGRTARAEELALLPADVAARRREQFVLGRLAAHDALAALGVPSAPVLRGPRDEPSWPAGVVGSLSHTANVGVAVVAHERTTAALGVDIETAGRLSERALARVCTPAELAVVNAAADPALAATLVFAAKEAVYKALDRRLAVRLGFQDVELVWHDESPRSATAFGHDVALATAVALPEVVVVAFVAAPGPTGGRQRTNRARDRAGRNTGAVNYPQVRREDRR